MDPYSPLLGPLLYLLFTSDIKQLIEQILKLYADDSLLIAVGNTEEECYANSVLCCHHLGVTMQRNGHWGLNSDNIIQRAKELTKDFTYFTSTQKASSESHFGQMYLSYIIPILEYDNCVWTYLTLEEVQRSMFGIMTS